jgi:hypothetical protein
MGEQKSLSEMAKELESLDGNKLLDFIKQRPIDTLAVIGYYQGWIQGARQSHRNEAL